MGAGSKVVDRVHSTPPCEQIRGPSVVVYRADRADSLVRMCYDSAPRVGFLVQTCDVGRAWIRTEYVVIMNRWVLREVQMI